MASVNTLCKTVLNVKNTVMENCNLYSDEAGVKQAHILNPGVISFPFLLIKTLCFANSQKQMLHICRRFADACFRSSLIKNHLSARDKWFHALQSYIRTGAAQ